MKKFIGFLLGALIINLGGTPLVASMCIGTAVSTVIL